MDDELKKARLNGYSQGYAAGKRRKAKEITYETKMAKERAFWQRAFIAALPAAFEAVGWTRGETKIASLEDRMRLARDAADEALKLARTHL